VREGLILSSVMDCGTASCLASVATAREWNRQSRTHDLHSRLPNGFHLDIISSWDRSALMSYRDPLFKRHLPSVGVRRPASLYEATGCTDSLDVAPCVAATRVISP
jgi:hypothetical protein